MGLYREEERLQRDTGGIYEFRGSMRAGPRPKVRMDAHMARRTLRLLLCIALMVIAVLLLGGTFGQHLAYVVAGVALLVAGWGIFRKL